ncbi:MAG: hypothetical protein WA970_16390, partial [Gammaproteobacteria bacterium]
VTTLCQTVFLSRLKHDTAALRVKRWRGGALPGTLSNQKGQWWPAYGQFRLLSPITSSPSRPFKIVVDELIFDPLVG